MAELLLLAAEAAAPEALAAAGAEAGAEALGAEALGTVGIPELLSVPELTSSMPFLESYIPPEIGIPELSSGVPQLDTVPNIETFPSPAGSEFVGPPQPPPSSGIEDLLKDPFNKLSKELKDNWKRYLIGAALASRRGGSNAPPQYSGPQILNRYRWAGARGGIASLANGGRVLPGYDVAVGEQPMYPQPYAKGGISDLGHYSDGGRMLKGPGDGMSDSIPGVIADKRPARLADSEFVVPADVVSHLGNGSTDAGAKQLYNMMNRVRMARTGTKKQGKQINPRRFVPA